jgi:S1-C subfamily serine protease
MRISPVKSRQIIMVAALCITLLPGALVFGQRPTTPTRPQKSEPLSAAARNRVRHAVEAVGLIFVRNAGDDPQPRPRGSGVVIRNDGILITNVHVISAMASKQVFDELYLALGDEAATTGKPQFRLEPVLIKREYDLALLRIRPNASGTAKPAAPPFPAIELADSQTVRLLDDIVIIGYPEKGGASVTLSTGVVEGRDTINDWIKTNARVIHGNSGGAAVNAEGKLIGIPTKVEADDQMIDRNGDGIPDAQRTYGAVGFLRPASLIASMLGQIDLHSSQRTLTIRPAPGPQTGSVNVRGLVRSAATGKPIAGAIVGLLPLGTERTTADSLLAYGSANGDGEFKLNKPVPPGRYMLKANALGHAPYSREVEISLSTSDLLIELRDSAEK